jgi:serine/threonine protein phosphatase PrpC
MLALEIDSVRRPKPGETLCGDDFSVTRTEDSCTIAVADGLGHGPAAALAARAAVEFVAANAREDLTSLVVRADRVLSATRGAALALLRFGLAEHRLEYAGVGNIELFAVARHGIRAINCPGYVGGRTRKVLVSSHRLAAGDLLAVCTDGVSSRLSLGDFVGRRAAETARSIVAQHAKDHDDATCVVVRVLEASHHASPAA